MTVEQMARDLLVRMEMVMEDGRSPRNMSSGELTELANLLASTMVRGKPVNDKRIACTEGTVVMEEREGNFLYLDAYRSVADNGALLTPSDVFDVMKALEDWLKERGCITE